MKKVFLKPKKEISVKRFHPWIFSGAIATKDEGLEDGDLVEVYSSSEQYLATGHYQNSSLQVRIISFEQTNADYDFWYQKLLSAFQFRSQNGLPSGHTNCYRLVHGEGDLFSGLIIDIYDKVAVVQCHSVGMHLQKDTIAKALIEVYGEKLEAVYDKSKKALPSIYADRVHDGFLHGEAEMQTVLENDHQFNVNFIKGQKTGFFLDQRENRKLLAQYSAGKTVLNAFCYTGGFSVYALKAGARLVHSVDLSEKAIQLTRQNIELNGFDNEAHPSYAEDVLDYLKRADTTYDLMIVDPPAFAKHQSKRHKAVQGYKRINALAMQKIATGGLLFTFSCSKVIDRQLFQNTMVAAALEARRQVRILHYLSQPFDHAASLYHPEGTYLKGLVLEVR